MIEEGLKLMGYEDTASGLKSLEDQELQRKRKSVGIDVTLSGAAAGGTAGAGPVTAVEDREPPNLDLADPNRRIWIFTTAW